MAEEEQDASTAFIRQRRDLFVISAALLVSEVARIRVEKLSFFGSEIAVENSAVLLGVPWILWMYWLLRYFQVFHNLHTYPVRSAYRNRLGRYVKEIARALAETDTREHIEKSGMVDASPAEWAIYDERVSCRSAYVDWMLRVQVNGTVKDFGKRRSNVGGWRYLRIQAKTVVMMCLSDTEVTEYVLPFLFAMTPVLYAAWQYANY